MIRFAPSLALIALAAMIPAQARAAATCLSEREVANVAVYAVPAIVGGVRSKCGASLPKAGFFAKHGDAFVAKYAALQDETWPIAKSAVLKLAGSNFGPAKADNPLSLFATLPDTSVRPLVDALISQKIGDEVKIADCENIERGFQLVSAMGPRDTGALAAFIVAMAKPKRPSICSSSDSAKAAGQ